MTSPCAGGRARRACASPRTAGGRSWPTATSTSTAGSPGPTRRCAPRPRCRGGRRRLRDPRAAAGWPSPPSTDCPSRSWTTRPRPQVRRVCADLGVRYLDAGRNRGFGGGVNLALDDRLDPTADVLLVNPDAVVGADDVTALHRALLADPALASVGPAQVDETGTPTRVGWPFPSPSRTWADGGRSRPRRRRPRGLRDRVGAAAAVRGAGPGRRVRRGLLPLRGGDRLGLPRRTGWGGSHAEVPLGDRDPRGRRDQQRPGTARNPLPRIAGALPAQALRRRPGGRWPGPGMLAGSAARSVLPGGRGLAARGRLRRYLRGPVAVERAYRSVPEVVA